MPKGSAVKAYRVPAWLRAMAVPAAAALGVIAILELVYPSIVRGASMRPTLEDGERILIERFTPTFGSLHRGDVVVLEPPGLENERFVKRIVGLPGDVVAVDDGQISVGGEVIARCGVDAGCQHTWVVPSDSVFVLGDNLARSFDSRYFGTVPLCQVIGRVVGR
ncbi:MAG TPA: signal peptidase I [Planctomycetota bacterium]|nr:signal peptidase I [Planctomycetota bacterium]